MASDSARSVSTTISTGCGSGPSLLLSVDRIVSSHCCKLEHEEHSVQLERRPLQVSQLPLCRRDLSVPCPSVTKPLAFAARSVSSSVKTKEPDPSGLVRVKQPRIGPGASIVSARQPVDSRLQFTSEFSVTNRSEFRATNRFSNLSSVTVMASPSPFKVSGCCASQVAGAKWLNSGTCGASNVRMI